jgi:hypothetical protein
MASAALESLGPTLALATHAIEFVVRPERVYCALFAEQTRTIHFHLFPRTAWLADKYIAANPDEAEISGPRLMDWARRLYPRNDIDRDSDEIVEGIRVFCGNHVPNTPVSIE